MKSALIPLLFLLHNIIKYIQGEFQSMTTKIYTLLTPLQVQHLPNYILD